MFVIPITKTWLVSKTADRIYFASAMATLTLVGTELGVAFAAGALDHTDLNGAPTLIMFFYRLIQISIPGTALLWVAMWLHWVRFNISKKGWWVVGLMMGPIGSVLYYFFVYRKQTREMLSEAAVVTTLVATNP
jgi:hypothetical protein